MFSIVRTRILTVQRVQTVIERKRSYKPVRCDAHMNELPVPCGAWSSWYNKKQRHYNQTFIAGALWFIFTVAFTIWTESLFFNWSPPVVPAPPLEMVGECSDEEC